MKIEKTIVGRSGIDFEIAGVNDDAERGVNGEGNTVDKAVRDLNRMHGQGAGFEAFAGTNFAQVGIIEEAVFVKLVFHVSQCELRSPDRNVELGEDPGQAADVVLVAVGKDDAANALAILDEIGNVRNYNVDAEEFRFVEH